MINKIIEAVTKECKNFFEQFTDINIDTIQTIEQSTIEFQPYTVLIGTGGADNTLFAISCDTKLLDSIMISFGFDDINEDNQEEYRDGTAYEVANMIIGGSLDKFPNGDHVTLTVPLLIGEASKIVKYDKSVLYTTSVQTNSGKVMIDIIQPKELVSQSKNLQEG